jgi:hypothetical protein
VTDRHPLRRLLARICSADTMSRVVDPTLADMRWESGRPRWLRYVDLVRALAFQFIASIPVALVRVYADDGHAIPKVVGWSAAIALLFATLLSIPPFTGSSPVLRESPLLFLACLLPQGLALSLPLALLVGIPVALHRQALSWRIVRRTMGLSLMCAAATFVVLAWIMPEANQQFRVLTYRAIRGGTTHSETILRGLNETGFSDIAREIARLKGDRGEERMVRRLTFNYHMRLSFAYVALPLALIALCVSASAAGRRRPMVIGFVALAGYVAAFYPLLSLSQTLALAAREPAVPAGVLAWAPASTLTLVAVAWLAVQAKQRFGT